jgi:DNA-binding transcriptional ArsR family regulator
MFNCQVTQTKSSAAPKLEKFLGSLPEATEPAPQLPAGPREVVYPERDDITIYSVLSALADPTRLEIVRIIDTEGEQCIGEFCQLTTKQNVTHHMKVLREAGLIKGRYEGRFKYISVRRALIDDMFPGLLDALLAAAPAGT